MQLGRLGSGALEGFSDSTSSSNAETSRVRNDRTAFLGEGVILNIQVCLIQQSISLRAMRTRLCLNNSLR